MPLRHFPFALDKRIQAAPLTSKQQRKEALKNDGLKKSVLQCKEGSKVKCWAGWFFITGRNCATIAAENQVRKETKKKWQVHALVLSTFSLSRPQPCPPQQLWRNFFQSVKKGIPSFICFKHVKSECARDHNGGGASSHPYTRWSKKNVRMYLLRKITNATALEVQGGEHVSAP